MASLTQFYGQDAAWLTERKFDPCSHTPLGARSSADMGPDFRRKRHLRLISMLALAAATAVITGQASADEAPIVDLATWTPPSIASVRDDPFGRLVKYGYALFTDTPNQIGPAAVDPASAFRAAALLARIAISRPAPNLTRCR